MGLGELSPWHLLILAAVVLVLFGAKRLPDSARSLGRAMRIFKSETSGLREGDKDDDGVTQAQAAPAPAQPAPAQPAAPPQLPASAPKDDGTLINGVPLSEAQRNQSG
ncbi:MAG TPA: Sec-independent protein translocase subunit TatA [Streptosporangiaceae bacterium]|nr:Sec-independent protein translocase subunit TatA [Streptosporangiaceae bacterium]